MSGECTCSIALETVGIGSYPPRNSHLQTALNLVSMTADSVTEVEVGIRDAIFESY
jgi:hypothetical protein